MKIGIMVGGHYHKKKQNDCNMYKSDLVPIFTTGP